MRDGAQWTRVSPPDDAEREKIIQLATLTESRLVAYRPDPQRWDSFVVYWIHDGHWHALEDSSQ